MSGDAALEGLQRYEDRLKTLEVEVEDLRSQLAVAEQGREVLRQAVDAQRQAMEAFPDLVRTDHLSESHATPTAAPAGVHNVRDNVRDVENVITMQTSRARRHTRRDKVINLLAQDPSRWWKVREIAAFIQDDKERSVRVTIGKLVHTGEVVRLRESGNSAWFRYNDGVDRPRPNESNAGQADDKEAMV